MKKRILSTLLVILTCILCAATLMACNPDGGAEEFTITFTASEGVAYEYQGTTATTAKAGADNVGFTVLITEGYDPSTLVVKANGATISAADIQISDNRANVNVKISADTTIIATVSRASWAVTLDIADELASKIKIYKPGTNVEWVNGTAITGLAHNEIVKFEVERLDETYTYAISAWIGQSETDCATVDYLNDYAYEDETVNTPVYGDDVYAFAAKGNATLMIRTAYLDEKVTLTMPKRTALISWYASSDASGSLEGIDYTGGTLPDKIYLNRGTDIYFTLKSDIYSVAEVNALRVFVGTVGSTEGNAVAIAGQNDEGYNQYRLPAVSVDSIIFVKKSLGGDNIGDIAPAAGTYCIPEFSFSGGATDAVVCGYGTNEYTSYYPYAYVDGVAVIAKDAVSVSIKAKVDKTFANPGVTIIGGSMSSSEEGYVDFYEGYNYSATIDISGVTLSNTLDIAVSTSATKKSSSVSVSFDAANCKVYVKRGNANEYTEITSASGSFTADSDERIVLKVTPLTASDSTTYQVSSSENTYALRLYDSQRIIERKTDADGSSYFVLGDRLDGVETVTYTVVI